MAKNFISLFISIFIVFNCLSQPYGGTIFVDPDIIVASDSSAILDVTYSGQENKTIFDRRVNNWISVNAFIFEVVWNDGLTSQAVVNPEFETVELAEIEARKYGRSIGQLPHCLRIDINEIWINKGVELFGGGNNSILIHTGHTVLYENDGILEETLVHEASHTSLDAKHAASPGWLEAQSLDGGFISDYAEDYPDREDIAESFLLWLAVRYRANNISTEDFNLITEAIPNRLNYFDGIACDLFPFQNDNTSALDELKATENIVQFYPNPVNDFLQIEFKEEGLFQTNIYNALGELLLSTRINTNQNIDLSNFKNGIYFLVIEKDGKLHSRKLMKF